MMLGEHTRRRFLATMGVGGAAAALAPDGAFAAPELPSDGGAFAQPLPGTGRPPGAAPSRVEAYPAPTAGTRYHLFNGAHFSPGGGTHFLIDVMGYFA